MASKRIILTDRLRLMPFAPEHAHDLFAMNSNPEVMRYLGDVQTLEDVKKISRGSKPDGKNLGMAGGLFCSKAATQ